MAKRAIFPLPLLLAGLLLLQTALIGCHGNKAETDTTHTETASTDTETVPEPVPVYPDSLPDGLDLGGMTVTMACRDGRDLIYCIGNEESVGEMVQDAIFERNMAVEERLNVVFGRYQYDKSWGEWGKYINTVVLAGEDAFQICFMENNSLLQDGGCLESFRDLSDNAYIDIEKPYWWTDSIRGLSLDGKSYYMLMGDLALSDYLKIFLTLYNRELYEKLYGDPTALYTLALDGGWTIDEMQRLCEGAYADLNGNGVVDYSDQCGAQFMDYWGENLYLDYSFDYTRCVRRENGTMEIAFDMDSATHAYDVLHRLFLETVGVIYTPYDKKPYEGYETDDVFAEGRMLFSVQSLTTCIGTELREMQDPYGMIPNPKLSDQQEQYVSYAEPVYTMIPTTVPDADAIGAVIEALASEAYVNVIDDFLELALQRKYSPDDLSSRCLRLILDTARCSFLYAYSSPANYIGHLLPRDTVEDKSFSSDYARKLRGAQNGLDKYVKRITGIAQS